MKKHKILFFFLIMPVLFAHAQPVHFENSIKTAFEKAKQENKPVFIEYYNSECPACMRLEPLFSDSRLGEYYNSHFVNYKLNTKNMAIEDSLFMSKSGIKLTSVPDFLFFNANENFLHYSETRPEVDYLLEIGAKALNPVERDANLENKYKSGDRSIKTLYTYSLLTQIYNKDSLTNLLADDLFNSFPKSDLGNRKSYIITKNCVKSVDNGFFKYWIQNLDILSGTDYEKYKGEGKECLSDIVFKSINGKEREDWNLDKIAQVKKYILLTGLSNNPEAFFWEQETKLLLAQKRYDEALAIGRKILDEEKIGITLSNSIILHYLTILYTIPELNTVKKWIDEITPRTQDKSDEANIMYLNALYYTKTNQTEKAKNQITEALEFYEKNKLETKSLTDLINTK